MVITEKSILYHKCISLTRTPEDYKKIYKSTTLRFWINEYRYFVKQHIHRTEQIKILLGNKVPLELYFKIMGYVSIISV